MLVKLIGWSGPLGNIIANMMPAIIVISPSSYASQRQYLLCAESVHWATYNKEPLPSRKIGDTSHMQDAVGDIATQGLDHHIAKEEYGETLRCFIALVPPRNRVEASGDETGLARP